MSDSGVRERPGRARDAARPAFDLVASKLVRPPVRPGSVGRFQLIERLMRADQGPLVSVVAPAGYGKTTLVSQWAERSGHRFAWVSADEADNDPKVLLTYVAEALDAVEPVGEGVFEALAAPVSSVPGSVVPRLGSAFASMTSPVVLVLDDVHLLYNAECRSALSVLADHVPAGSRLVFASRAEPPLRIARLRAEGRLLEIGPRDLSLTREEASSLLRGAGVTVSEGEAAELHRRTEGWPAGLYLAALCIREGGSPGSASVPFDGSDRLVSEYLESEFLARISPRQRAFLTRTAALERMCGPLCDAVLGQGGSAAVLADLAQSNLLLVPLDRRGEWYRYHHLFRDMLLAELHRLEPGQLPVLRRRAAGWYLENGLPEEALEYSIMAEDVDQVAGLAAVLATPAYWQGRVATVQRWFGWLEARGRLEKYPLIAALASFLAALTGRPVEAERWADAVDRWQYGDVARPADPPAEAWAALLRALLCRGGVEQMRADAEEGANRCAAAGIVAPAAALLQGIGCVLGGDPDGGDAFFQAAAGQAEEVGAHETHAQALAERCLVAIARDAWGRAEVLAGQAGTVLHRVGIEAGLVRAVQARVAAHRGDAASARQHLVHAQQVRPLMTYAQPHLAVQARIELIRVHLALADMAGARTLMREIDELLLRRPHLGTLAAAAEALRAQPAKRRGSGTGGASALTAAELRLLPMLATHLSFPQIAEEMYLSRYTIKAQAISIYRKLGTTSRNQAVARARELALLEG